MSEAASEGASGGCQCGAVRYRIVGSFGHAGICHCRMCQKAFGSWGAALVSLPVAGLAWTRGRPAEFRSSAIVARGFCRDCGTPLFMRQDGDANYEIAIGSLDDPNGIPPLDRQSGVESKCRWFDRMAALPRETTESYRSPEDMRKLKSLQHPDHDTEHWP
ncbi:MAG: GFA family protein [Alphaproteobacteria bacterium]|nr:GFA family protein [Alphaproteobacteria bacterium]